MEDYSGKDPSEKPDEESTTEQNNQPGESAPDETSEETSEEAPEEIPEDTGSKTRVAIDWVELEGALENNSPELHSFLNKVTGDVIRVFRGSEDSENRMREVETDPDYLYVEPISSREQYRWMEEFIETSEESNLKDKLNIAIDGKGAFRRFKDVLLGYPEDRERWFGKRSLKLRAHIVEWLSAKGIIPINIPPWDQDEHEQGEDVAAGEKDGTTTPKDAGTDLRRVAHDLVDLVPSRELQSAVAFLEFLRSRRGFRRPRYS